MGLRLFREFGRDERGATAIEYAMMAAMIAVAILSTLVVLGNSMDGLFDAGVNTASNTLAARASLLP